eukprot:TRINITY_DN23541_c0_g1_i1.p1 TRINITY_DN23541_c0_g1~~TRINITY_DN23541_c0_g1_i1.p1  ORF type:complete len:626 (+),score=101.78 TRINITY_DN23541_c0_g1_i1:281-1879(+)
MPPENVITTLAGDFLAPSLLSSMDSGYGMVQVLNRLPIDIVCFGNHDGNDVSHAKLSLRIQEYDGIWLNSNIPDFDPQLPAYHLRELVGANGKRSVRKVAFMGFCIGGGPWAGMYRDNAFGGAHRTMRTVVPAAKALVEDLKKQDPSITDFLPLTHQDMMDDIELAKTGHFSAILAGHDHDRMHEVVKSTDGVTCQVVKAGENAEYAAIVDFAWHGDSSQPTVTVAFKKVASYEADKRLEQYVQKMLRPVRELESAILYELKPPETLSSIGAKFQDVSMARMLATAVKVTMNADAAVVNSGAVRGNKMYTTTVSFGDLQKECPYPSAVVVVAMPFEVLRDAVELSRKPWLEVDKDGKRKEANSALQVDEDIDINEHHVITSIDGLTLEECQETEKIFEVACDSYFLQKNAVFKKYCQQHYELIPPMDVGRPLLPILVDFFCGRMWKELLKDNRASLRKSTYNSAIVRVFERFDSDHNGVVSTEELQKALQLCLGEKLSSRIIVEQMIHLVDGDDDSSVSEKDLRRAFHKIMR